MPIKNHSLRYAYLALITHFNFGYGMMATFSQVTASLQAQIVKYSQRNKSITVALKDDANLLEAQQRYLHAREVTEVKRSRSLNNTLHIFLWPREFLIRYHHHQAHTPRQETSLHVASSELIGR